MLETHEVTEAPEAAVAALEAEAAAVQTRLAAARQRQEAEARRTLEERAAPLRAEIGALEAKMANVEERAHAVLRDAVTQGRELYRELCELTAQRRALRGQVQAITGTSVVDYPPPPFGAFVRGAVARFNAEGNGAWATQEGGGR